MESQFNLPGNPVETGTDILLAARELMVFIRRHQTEKGDVATAILETAKQALVPYKGSWNV